MSCGVFIIAHKNEFNQNVLHKNSSFFINSNEVNMIIDNLSYLNDSSVIMNTKIIEKEFSWEKITKKYISFFKRIYK